MKQVALSVQALKRLPFYLQYLNTLKEEGHTNTSAALIATKLKLSEIQVRKDFAAVSSTQGKPKKGFLIDDLITQMETILGYHNEDDVILIGAGKFGRALIGYDMLKTFGFHVATAFDKDKRKIGTQIDSVKVMDIDNLVTLVQRMKIQIGIICVPKEEAQASCDLLIEAGIKAIWNFAPVHLNVPDDVLIINEELTTSLVLLSQHVQKTN